MAHRRSPVLAHADDPFWKGRDSALGLGRSKTPLFRHMAGIAISESRLSSRLNGAFGSIVRVRAVRFAVDVGFAAGYHCEQPAK